MYTSFFGLNEKPFSITPDPRYLFLSERHGEALAHLVYGVTESGGFIQLTGEVGTGKTTLVRSLLLNRMPDNADVAVVLNPQLSVVEFLATICEELHIEVTHNRGSVKALTDALNRHLLDAHAADRRTILVVDEAQNLAPAVLEQVRLLTNLETAKQKLLQIVLIGQEELRDLLARNDLRQLAQRITARYHLEPLSREETKRYIEHRLKVAGAVGEVFDSGAMNEVYRLSQGVPRLINVICDRALLGAYARESRRANARLIREAAAEVKGELQRSPWLRRAAWAAGIAGVAVVAASVWLLAARSTGPAEVPETTGSGNFTAAAAQPEPVPAADAGTETLALAEPISEPEPEPEPEPTLQEQLRLAGDLTSPDYALASLFDAWGIEYRTGGRSGCAQAAAAGLACLSQRGSLAGLALMDRPAILTLVDDAGNRHDVTLTAIDGEQAELSIGGVSVKHSIGEISRTWFGGFLLLWRPPTGSAVTLSLGAQGPAVAWLRDSLATIDDRYVGNDALPEVFDAELERTVRSFQRDHRLAVDGVAGRQTQIIINSLLAAENTPRLSKPASTQD
ncbi:MAG: AAA family ATPase [Gammaproteobacteria bacterium]|nr:AAA family ATPase [Gammaproteobacteria bacterium]NNF48754.1 AAA family ATPase [Woeseiaceae bacterium]MBT8094599.1 AAA family ATPase [Gammaproteobacteria bacterium]MBT8106364.1 AAA family ATPase [Gammaproteobacteria bacterium]NNK26379.1 AAA family ATPase [Woeseiaceae bacterium]